MLAEKTAWGGILIGQYVFQAPEGYTDKHAVTLGLSPFILGHGVSIFKVTMKAAFYNWLDQVGRAFVDPEHKMVWVQYMRDEGVLFSKNDSTEIMLVSFAGDNLKAKESS